MTQSNNLLTVSEVADLLRLRVSTIRANRKLNVRRATLARWAVRGEGRHRS